MEQKQKTKIELRNISTGDKTEVSLDDAYNNVANVLNLRVDGETRFTLRIYENKIVIGYFGSIDKIDWKVG